MNEHQKILWLCAAGLFAAFALFLGVLVYWPYLVFYLLPFVLGSALFGYILRYSVSKDANGIWTYRGLGLAFPVILSAILICFFVGSGRVEVQSQTGNYTRPDWPELNQMFKRARALGLSHAPFNFMRLKVGEPVIYDRQEIGVILLFSLIFGAPAVFFILASSDEESDVEVLKSIRAANSDMRENAAIARQYELDAELKKVKRAAEIRDRELEEIAAKLNAELKKLRARDEFSSRPKQPGKAGNGVLDSDIF